MSMTTEQKRKAYETMYKIRQFDLTCPKLFAEGLVAGEAHQYIGEEAVAAGVSAALTKEDSVTSTHRGHGHLIAKGGDVKYMFAELGGKATGYCHGKGGSMHITSREVGIYGANGMVGQGVGIALGVAFADKYLKDGTVTAAYFGDGASNEGLVHECMNLASILKLPMLFICENNKYAITTDRDYSTSAVKISDRAAGYNMPGVTVDGMDVEAVYEATKAAADRARRGEGPSFIECECYRFFDHFASYPKICAYQYRDPKEVEEWKQRDPIAAFGAKLVSEGTATADDLKAIEAAVDAEIEAGVEFMKIQPDPVPEDAFKDAYANEHYTMPVKGW
jgi:TPP-dependent pyruvate/acetoin dehydrogenase alpha subunit